MKIKTRIIFIYLYVIITNVMLAQTYDEIKNGIKSALEQKYGSSAYVGCFVNIDKEKNKYHEWNLEFKDPYGTLTNCYVFTATVNERGIAGIYKNETILWDSGPMAYYGKNQQILTTTDLNNDGNVEILAGWYVGMRNPIANIWIISWNGATGEIINKIVSNSDSWLPQDQESEIYAYDYLLDFLDIDGDGILEIKGTDINNTDRSKLYSWNGEKYGDYGITMPAYVPMNLLTAKVKCKVSKSQYGLLYNYTVKNDSASKQKIWNVVVDKPFEDIFENSNAPDKKWSMRGGVNKIKWDVSEDLQDYPFDYIMPGKVKSDFRIETNSPTISICNYYLQGKNGKKIYKNQYIEENSFKGKTICGKNPPEPFVAVDFLDTLTTYTDNSYALGWITDEQIRDKYNNYFNTAKTYLEQGDSSAARAELEKVLTDCNTDSSTVLTSEAYALLYFNTEYLVNKLRKTPQVETSPVKTENKTKRSGKRKR